MVISHLLSSFPYSINQTHLSPTLLRLESVSLPNQARIMTTLTWGEVFATVAASTCAAVGR